VEYPVIGKEYCLIGSLDRVTTIANEMVSVADGGKAAVALFIAFY
jgi:hypothetical protein